MVVNKNKMNFIETEIYDLIPHRPPMLLINKIVSLTQNSSESIVIINEKTPFYQNDYLQDKADDKIAGVPSWIGLEYMGQTAALIAGYQLREGLTQPHLGFLLGCRNYTAMESVFKNNSELLVSCEQGALVGDSLATFNCHIYDSKSKHELANASLSVFRKPITN